MPDFFKIFSTWKKEILFLVVMATIITTALVFILPGKYLATSTALPANAAAADKATVFNNSIQELSSAIGTPDDVEKIVGTGQLDTVYLATAAEFDLPAHYQVKETGTAAFLKAAQLLKKDTRVTKTEYGELRVMVWDKSKRLAPQLANSIMNNLGVIHQNLQNEVNRKVIESLKRSQVSIQLSLDSVNSLIAAGNNNPASAAIRKTILQEQAIQYAKMEAEYQLILDSNPVALLIVEKARESNRPDKPKRLVIIISAVILSFIFAFLLALLLERRKSAQ